MLSLRKIIENKLTDDVNVSNIGELLPKLIVAFKFNLNKFLAKVISEEPHFINLSIAKNKNEKESLNCVQLSLYFKSSLSKDFLYELIKNTIKKLFHKNGNLNNNIEILQNTKHVYVEVLDILSFLDMVYYDDQIIESSSTRRKIYEDSPYEYDTKGMIGRVTCGEEFEDRATLIVEGKRINVKLFVLTDNSPVFKVMLQSTSFKEGQTKAIELPGKLFDEIVYLLQHLQLRHNITSK